MDVGMTRSGEGSPYHWITGSIVFLSGYAAALLAIRDMLF
jgi:hypothetical protein